ncbi:PREDICTED: B3 domain-containing protein IDEF1 [Nelumbo nucifera]|nr:PREDICTED: B3 domain-containing protein IDEF1 [Nelumbo nucifera]
MENTIPRPVTTTPTTFPVTSPPTTTVATTLSQEQKLRNIEYGKELQLGFSPLPLPPASVSPLPPTTVPTPNHPFSTPESRSTVPYSQDHHHQHHNLSESQYYSYVFSPDYASSSSIFPVFPLMVDPSVIDNGLPSSMVGGLLDGYYPTEKFIDKVGLENSCFLESMAQSQVQQKRLWGSITKAARSKRRIARRMNSISSPRVGPPNQNSSSSSSPGSPSSNKNLSFSADAAQSNSNCDTDRKKRELFTFTKPHNRKLRLLLQKELKNSDVNSLGRIILPKKDSEANLPTLTVKEGFQITVRDLASSKVWHMRYRFWPNNKSRMYVLENTGDFVKQKSLKTGDSIMLYQDESNQFFICAKRAEDPPFKFVKDQMEDSKEKFCNSFKGKIEEDGHEPSTTVEERIDEDEEETTLGKDKVFILEDGVSSSKISCFSNDTLCGTSTQLAKEAVKPQSLKEASDLDCFFSELEMLPNFGACDLSLYNDFINDFAYPGGENGVVAK